MVVPDPIDPLTVPAWNHLEGLVAEMRVTPTRELLRQSRDFLRPRAAGIEFDFSRQRIDQGIVDELLNLADKTGVFELRDSMFAGEQINNTEQRAVLHTALRTPRAGSVFVDGRNVVPDVHAVLDRMINFADHVRDGSWKGATGEAITDVVNIGIGGSDLGPAMAYLALRPYVQEGLRCHFVSNVDPADMDRVLAGVDPSTTLFIIASKTFTTQETIANAQLAKDWLVGQLGPQSVPLHFVAVSTNRDLVSAFGIDAENMFGFWDWVGGRYSMTSAIGLSTMLAIGPANFRDLLDGFHAMDTHFLQAAPSENVPLLMGLIAVWNRNFLGIPTTAVLPYSQDLARFPAYLQQLTMESNGKSVRRDGVAVTYETGSIYWGEPGTGGQHSFYQLLHQGTSDVASDIVIVARPAGWREVHSAEQHEMLAANALAQASVLSVGLTRDEVREAGVPEVLIPHKIMQGSRPVSVIMMPELTPFTLGALIAAYEHSVFVQGAVWQINPFDQWGVELGKQVAKGILSDIQASQANDSALDSATRASLAEYLDMREQN